MIIARGIDSSNDKGLDIQNKLENLPHGNITIIKGSAKFQDVTNSGTIFASGKNSKNIGLEAGIMYNYGSITIVAGNLKLNNNATNDGYINSQYKTIIATKKTITNRNYFITKSLQLGPTIASNSYFINAQHSKIKPVAEFTDIINAPVINIENQGSLLLQGGSTIASYVGDTTSELVLNLPSNTSLIKTSLLKIINGATFTQGAKIILAINNKLSYLTMAQSVTIVTAKQLAINNRIDELLYSRTYDKSMSLYNSQEQQLATNSILLKITQAKKVTSSGHEALTANLELVKVASSTTMQTSQPSYKLAQSLVKNTVVQAKQMQFIPTTSTISEPIISKSVISASLATTTPALTTTKPTIAKKPMVKPKITTKQQKYEMQTYIDNSGIEHSKPIDNHFRLINNIIENYTIEVNYLNIHGKKYYYVLVVNQN